MKKVVSVLAALAVLMTATLTVSATHIGSAADNIGAVVSDALLRAEFEKLSAAQKDAVDAYEILFKSFEKDENNNRIYPREYAGTHIEDNILHIHIVDLENQDISRYQVLLADYLDDIAFVEAKYSLNELLAEAKAAYDNLVTRDIKIIGYCAKQQYNAIGVVVESGEKAKLRTTSKGVPENHYQKLIRDEGEVPVYIEYSEVPENCFTLQGGTPVKANGRNYTLGICGTYEGAPAVAMCGHGLSGEGERVYYVLSDGTQGTLIGTVLEHQHEYNGTGDYAIVSNSRNVATRALLGDPDLLDDCYTLTGSCELPSEGTLVVKYGETAGYAFGRVDGLYNGILTSGNVINGLVRVDMTAGRVMRGDSGGPIFTGDGKFCGTMSNAQLHNNNGTETETDDYGTVAYYFSPYMHLVDRGFQVSVP